MFDLPVFWIAVLPTLLTMLIIGFVIVLFVRKASGGAGGIGGGGGGLFGPTKQQLGQAQALQAHGRKARAQIIDLRPTGVIINQINIQCRVTFALQPLDGGPAYQAQKVITVNQTAMPRIGDLWPAWIDPVNPEQFAVGAPSGSSPEQVAIFREFGIPHPLDQVRPAPTPAPGPAQAPAPGMDRVGALERLARLHRSGALSDVEFQTEKARLLGS